MRKFILLITSIIMAVLFAGCTNEKTQAEGDVKTETVVENIETGMIPQVIEKSVTYVMKDGNWKEEGTEITDWKWADDFVIQDTVWILESDDATKLYSDLDVSFKGKPVVAYIHFKSDQREATASTGETDDKTPKMDISISISCDIILECKDEKFCFEGVKVSGGECFMDGTCNIFMDLISNIFTFSNYNILSNFKVIVFCIYFLFIAHSHSNIDWSYNFISLINCFF